MKAGEVEPIYRRFEGGWKIDSSTMKTYDQLPEKAKFFVEELENFTGIPVKFIGIGPDDSEMIVRD